MKICIIVFSPSGHTLKVADMIKSVATSANDSVQLLNITSVVKLHRENKIEKYLSENILPHDVLCVGAPVYAGHFENTLLSMLSHLPSPDSTFGRLSAPFVTYGGIHSSIALSEAAEILSSKGRINVSALKIRAFHTLSKTFGKDSQLNADEPNDDIIPLIQDFLSSLHTAFNSTNPKDISSLLDYAPEEEKKLFHKKSQADFHRDFRARSINYDHCRSCGICVKSCPVNMFEFVDNKVVLNNQNSHCILCAECFHNCPNNAINFSYIDVAKPRLMQSPSETIASEIFHF